RASRGEELLRGVVGLLAADPDGDAFEEPTALLEGTETPDGGVLMHQGMRDLMAEVLGEVKVLLGDPGSDVDGGLDGQAADAADGGGKAVEVIPVAAEDDGDGVVHGEAERGFGIADVGVDGAELRVGLGASGEDDGGAAKLFRVIAGVD